jgi:hypothetical protein
MIPKVPMGAGRALLLTTSATLNLSSSSRSKTLMLAPSETEAPAVTEPLHPWRLVSSETAGSC